MKRTLTLAMVTLALISLSLPLQGQETKWTQTFTGEMDFFITPTDFPCLTETIHFTGKTVYTVVTAISSPESLQAHFSVNQHLLFSKGIGLDPVTLLPTGNTYIFNGPFHQTINGTFPPDAPISATFHNLNHYVGRDLNIFQFTLYHFVYDRTTGLSKVEVTREAGFCQAK